MNLFTTKQIKTAESDFVAQGGTFKQLLEQAGLRVAEMITEQYPIQEKEILFLIGPGKNGTDGLIAANHLASWGAHPTIYLSHPRETATDPFLAPLAEKGVLILLAETDKQYQLLNQRLHLTDLIVDALFGIGFNRPITDATAHILRQIKDYLKRIETQLPPLHSITTSIIKRKKIVPIIAVDCPSGLNCDTGEVDPLTLQATMTISFTGLKYGHIFFPGAEKTGNLIVANVGIQHNEQLPFLLTVYDAKAMLPQRPLNGHKGRFGTALIAAGSEKYWGAPLLAARAAYRAGAGIVALAVPSDIRESVATQLPEATFPPLADRSWLQQNAALKLREELHNYQAVLIGPGLARADFFMPLFLAQKEDFPPTIIDADGLNWLATEKEWWQLLPQQTLLTPHPGEFARLMGIDKNDLPRNRVASAQQQAKLWGHTVLLKGAYTIIAAPDGKTAILPWANPKLAVAGSGDLLSGIIVGLLAQGLSIWDAACLGGYLHGASATKIPIGSLAREIGDQIPAVWTDLYS